MLTHDRHRIDAKRRSTLHHRKQQFAEPAFQAHDYPHRLSLYEVPPTAEITLEQFEQWAIDRLRILAELEASSFRNRSPAETATHLGPLLDKYLPLRANTAARAGAADPVVRAERQKDHYAHYILRLAFAGTADLRARFVRLETRLFRLRLDGDDSRERAAFVAARDFGGEAVGEAERKALAADLLAASPGLKRAELDEAGWVKVDWEQVPELVEARRVLVRAGKAYVPGREQQSLVVTEFQNRLARAMEVTARQRPRLDEDDRLTPILDHLARSFATPDATLADADAALPGARVHAGNVDALAAHFPLCMGHLQRMLKQNGHLKHYGRLQYTLFLKGIGLSLDDCLTYWRRAFRHMTDDQFNRDHRYNVRHAYGEVGGDANRRGRGYAPHSCQRILTQNLPSTKDEHHGCPYKEFKPDNLVTMLQGMGVGDREVLKGVRDDIGNRKYHIACNRVFDWAHRAEIRRAKDEGAWTIADSETIVHPNTYFKRSYLLKSGEKFAEQGSGDAMEE